MTVSVLFTFSCRLHCKSLIPRKKRHSETFTVSEGTEQNNFLECGYLLQRSCCEHVGCSRSSSVSCVSLLSCTDGWLLTFQAAWRIFSTLLRQLKSTKKTERGSTQPAPSPCWEVCFLTTFLRCGTPECSIIGISGHHAVSVE